MTTHTRTALYHRPGGKGRWRLFDTYHTRDEAFRAVDDLPERHPVFRLEDVPHPQPETDPTQPARLFKWMSELRRAIGG